MYVFVHNVFVYVHVYVCVCMCMCTSNTHFQCANVYIMYVYIRLFRLSSTHATYVEHTVLMIQAYLIVLLPVVVCMHVYMCDICMCMCMHLCMYVYVCVCACIYVCMFTYAGRFYHSKCVLAHTLTRIVNDDKTEGVYVCMYALILIRILILILVFHSHSHTHAHAHTHIRTHTHTQPQKHMHRKHFHTHTCIHRTVVCMPSTCLPQM